MYLENIYVKSVSLFLIYGYDCVLYVMVANISDLERQSGVRHVFFMCRPCTTFLVAMRFSLAYLDYMWGNLITIIYTILLVIDLCVVIPYKHLANFS